MRDIYIYIYKYFYQFSLKHCKLNPNGNKNVIGLLFGFYVKNQMTVKNKSTKQSKKPNGSTNIIGLKIDFYVNVMSANLCPTRHEILK